MGQQPAWRRSPVAHCAEKSKIWGKAQAGQGEREQLGQRVLAAGLDAWPSKASSHHTWQISTKGNSAVSLGNISQALVGVTVENFFFYPVTKFGLTQPHPSHCEGSAMVICTKTFQIVKDWPDPGSFSLSSRDKVSIPITILVCPNFLVSLLSVGDKKGTQGPGEMRNNCSPSSAGCTAAGTAQLGSYVVTALGYFSPRDFAMLCKDGLGTALSPCPPGIFQKRLKLLQLSHQIRRIKSIVSTALFLSA